MNVDLTAATWHNWRTSEPIMRSLTDYDHDPLE